ncbi:MAG: efflux RND transporter periplasmic adaptor subunit [Desulfobacterales bacterium]
MAKTYGKHAFQLFLILNLVLLVAAPVGQAQNANRKPSGMLVRVAEVAKRMISDQISLVGTAESTATSIVASEVSGIVEAFPVREGDFVKKGAILARLRSTDLNLRLRGALAGGDKIKAGLLLAEKELERVKHLKTSDSIAERKYDDTVYQHSALSQDLVRSEAEIERLRHEIKQKHVVAPFSGFIAKEHTQIGEWVRIGGPVVTLMDLRRICITVDVPERYAVMLSRNSEVNVGIKSVSSDVYSGKIYAVVPQGDIKSRTFPVKIRIDNPGFTIKAGMEAMVAFNLGGTKEALVVPKDAVVSVGNNKEVYAVVDGKAVSVSIRVLGYYEGDVAVEGELKPGDQVVIRGNERLRTGAPVVVSK